MTMLDEKPKRIVDEAEFGDAPAGGKTYTLTEAQLRQLVSEMVAKGGGTSLPPGAYRTETGETFRDIQEPTGRVRTNPQTGKLEQINRVVQKRVYIVHDPSPEGLRTAYRACQASGLHWYHPRLGWYRGTKREIDVEQNLGAGAELFEMAFAEMPTEEDYGTSTVTMQGVPKPADDDDTDEIEEAPESVGAVRSRSRTEKHSRSVREGVD